MLASSNDPGQLGGSLFGRAELGARRTALVDLDPDLFRGLGPRELMRIREVGTPVVELEAGEWEPPYSADAGLGLLILDGLLMRRMSLGNDVATELVGPGDLIRPWVAAADNAAAILDCPVGWTVLHHTRIAVLGRQVALAAAECPGLVLALLDRTSQRSRSQGIFTAISHLKRIDLRVLVLLWHLAERWGRVTPDGVVIPLRLTHQRLALLVGAQRPSVTAALSRMATRGLVERTPNRGFLLTAAADDELATLCRDGERAVAPLISMCA